MAEQKIIRTDVYRELKEKFIELVKQHDLYAEGITIKARGLSADEAIGNTGRKDFPLLTGKEVLLQAEYKGSAGQAFTDAPASFSGLLSEILELDIEENSRDRGLFIASLNAVTRYLSVSDRTIHCRDEGPELCAGEFAGTIESEYGNPKIALIGFQPAFIEALVGKFNLRVLDMNPDNVGRVKHDIRIEHGIDDYDDAVLNWADLVFCTGSTVANGTIGLYAALEKEVIFFGTTIAGAAGLLGYKRWCPRSV